MISIDGSTLEGGGQIIRTALALSTITGKPFSAFNIRKAREAPGLKAQHLHCIKALEKLCSAKVFSAELGSEKLEYYPQKIEGKTISVDIGTAGSVSLLLQSVLLPALHAETKTRFKIKGGTSGKGSMSFDFFKEIILPQLKRFADIEAKQVQRGYYPKGNGNVEVIIKPKKDFKEINLAKQGTLVQIKGISHASMDLQNAEVAERQARSAKLILSKLNCPVNIQTEYSNTLSPGSGITLWAIFSEDENNFDILDIYNPIILGAEALGEKTKRAEVVGKEAADDLIKEIESKSPVDKHTADNLIPFLAVFGGKIKVSEITLHTMTNIWVCEQFLEKKFEIDNENKIISIPK